jgi:ethanolaminephosphotransferase
MTVSYGFMWYFNPTLEPDVSLPWWTFAFHAISMLIYQTLDNMDGKQARRTNSSSPLGLLFDHGCDALNSIFGSVGWILSLGLNPYSSKDLPLCAALVLGPFCMFYVATWEEYYTGELILPVVNGPNEGLFGGAMLSLTTCFLGTEFWQSTSVYDALLSSILSTPVRNADIQVAVAIVGILKENIAKTSFVGNKYGWKTLKDQVPLWLLVVLPLLVDAQVWLRMPRTTLHLMSALFVEPITQLMLDHIADEPYSLSRRVVMLPLFGLPLLSAGTWSDSVLLIYATAVWTYIALKFCIVIHEVCCLLGIKCFDITSSHKVKVK